MSDFIILTNRSDGREVSIRKTEIKGFDISKHGGTNINLGFWDSFTVVETFNTITEMLDGG